jgi:LPXTG-motif cell wall-anchored protein
MIRRTLVLLGSALLALLLFAPAASAQYPSDDSISVDNPNPDVGDTIVVSGDCFPPGSTVTVTLTQGGNTVVLGTTTSDANGHYSIAVVIPAGFSAGPATLTACGVSIVINIGGATVATLPRTGSSSSLPMARIAVVLVAAGGLLVLSARKRAARASVDT